MFNVDRWDDSLKVPHKHTISIPQLLTRSYQRQNVFLSWLVRDVSGDILFLLCWAGVRVAWQMAVALKSGGSLLEFRVFAAHVTSQERERYLGASQLKVSVSCSCYHTCCLRR